MGWGIWVTGLPSSGKSTITNLLVEKLEERGVGVQVLESDALRRVLTPEPTYSPGERETFYTSMAHIGWLFSRNGVNVIFDAVANRRRWRASAREKIPRFMEVYVRCPLEVCRERDPKGIYRMADEGGAQYVPGQQQAYEEPTSPELVLDCEAPPAESMRKILEAMEENGFI